VTAPDPASLAAGIFRALTEPGLYDRLSEGARQWSASFTWERASGAFERALIAAARAHPAAGE
jgi:glycosyltransferase involved in cell wall biosynthesis